MPKTDLTLVVPIKDLPIENIAAEVWGEVTKRLLPDMGKLYTQFYPNVQPWGHGKVNPFGVVLGKTDPMQFLELYAVAKIAQMGAIDHHLNPLISEAKSKSESVLGETLICVVDGSSSEEVKSHSLWNILLHEGEILPDCGIYYAHLRKSLISESQEKAICEHLADYALCVVSLEVE